MKYIVALPAVLLTLLVSSFANAGVFETSFTSDNRVTGFSYFVDGVETSVDVSNLAGVNSWRQSSQLSLNVGSGNEVQFVWETLQNGQYETGNPTAFLAEFSFDNNQYLTDNIVWEARSEATGNQWVQAVLNFGNGTDAYNQGDNIWGTRAPVDISNQAQWIWDGVSTVGDETIYYRATVQASAPSTIALAGLVMVFLAYRARK